MTDLFSWATQVCTSTGALVSGRSERCAYNIFRCITVNIDYHFSNSVFHNHDYTDLLHSAHIIDVRDLTILR